MLSLVEPFLCVINITTSEYYITIIANITTMAIGYWCPPPLYYFTFWPMSQCQHRKSLHFVQRIF